MKKSLHSILFWTKILHFFSSKIQPNVQLYYPLKFSNPQLYISGRKNSNFWKCVVCGRHAKNFQMIKHIQIHTILKNKKEKTKISEDVPSSNFWEFVFKEIIIIFWNLFFAKKLVCTTKWTHFKKKKKLTYIF